MTNRFTPKAKEALERAREQAKGMGHTYIGTEHLLLGIMCTDGVGSKILDDKGALYTEIYDHVVEISGFGAPNVFDFSLTPRCKRVIEGSASCAKRTQSEFIGTEHLLYSIANESDCVGARVLSSLGISTQGVKNEIHSLGQTILDACDNGDGEISSAPTLSLYGKSLNASAFIGKIDPLIGRDDDISQLVQILCRRTKNNPCLIGEPGVGKTAIVEGLAQKIVDGNVPSELKDKIIVSLDLTSVIAGTKYRGEFEERMRAILNEVRANPAIILFIDEIHTIMGVGGAEGAIDGANIIKPALARGELRVIGATTTNEYRRYIEKDLALERRFQPILIEEPSEQEAIKILDGLKPLYEAHHKIRISNEAILACVKLSVRYINDRFLPDKAIDLLDEACASVKTSDFSPSPKIKELEKKIYECSEQKEEAIIDKNLSLAMELKEKEAELGLELYRLRSSSAISPGDKVINREDICKIVSKKTKIPLSGIDKKENEGLLSLEGELSQKIIGQGKAIACIVSAIKRGRLGLSNPNRPCASFLFAGPTGVGKTMLAKELANSIFKNSSCFIRFDMSEFSEKHSISRLIGAPAGYIGYEDGGKLCEAVRRHPYSVVLFDEIEKAHPDIYGLLLQILDEGILCSADGKSINFKNTIIILTSNIGAEQILSSSHLGFSGGISAEEQNHDIRKSLKSVLSPELINRLDEIVTFNTLSFEDTKKICISMLEGFKERAKNAEVELSFSDDAIDFVAKKGYSKELGARNIQRAIISFFENPFCEALLNGEIKANSSAVARLSDSKIYYECLNI